MLKKLIKLFKPKPRISVLTLSGVIGKVGVGRSGMSLCALNDLIEAAFEKPKTRAVILAINSPGGSPVQSELIAARIMELSKEKKIPIYSFVEDVAASGGYWLACAGEKIYASKSSILGSIGVISAGFGLKDAIKKLGIERRIITQGKNKSVLDPFADIKMEDIALINDMQKDIHEHFIDFVKKSRGKRLKETKEELFGGKFWSGVKSKELGLIDGIDNMHNFIKTKFGEKVRIDYIKPRESWFKRKFLSSFNARDLVNAMYDRCEEEITYSNLYQR